MNFNLIKRWKGRGQMSGKENRVGAKAWELINTMRREDETALQRNTADLGEVREIPTRGGMGRILLYPSEPGKPVFFNIHGGGFVAGRAESDAEFCDKLHRELGIWVINMEYRLAPEAACPADKEDIYDMLCYLYERKEEYPFDRQRMLIGGHSAGANIAATVSKMLKDDGKFSFLAQVLNCPPLDFATPPREKFFGQGAVEPEAADVFTISYCPPQWDLKDERLSPYWLPAECLTGLPDALVITAEFDSLRDEAEAYAKKLMQAGVEVTGKRFKSKRHAFAGGDPDGQDYIFNYIKWKLQGKDGTNL